MSAGPPSATEPVRLRDGSLVGIRQARDDDEPALAVFLADLSPEARRRRFFTGAADTHIAARWAARTGADRCGLLAHDQQGALVAHASYAALEPDCAEVAVEVADHLHGRGLGTILIERLATIAEQHGISRFIAHVLHDNRAMLDVFRDGFGARVTMREGIEVVEFPTGAWRLAHERFAAGAAEAEKADHRRPPDAGGGD